MLTHVPFLQINAFGNRVTTQDKKLRLVVGLVLYRCPALADVLQFKI